MFGKNKHSGPERASDVKTWYKDRYQAAVVWRNIMALATLLALVVSGLSVFTVLQLAPLKSVEPFVIQVDDKTGVTQVVNPLSAKQLTANEAVNNFFIVQYVRARETYDMADFVYSQRVVHLMSEPYKVFAEYRRAISGDNPESPTARLKLIGTRTVQMRSISYISPQTAQVRFTVSERLGQDTKEMHKIALLEFKYADIDLNAEDRYINPLGFIVTSYRVDEDTL